MPRLEKRAFGPLEFLIGAAGAHVMQNLAALKALNHHHLRNRFVQAYEQQKGLTTLKRGIENIAAPEVPIAEKEMHHLFEALQERKALEGLKHLTANNFINNPELIRKGVRVLAKSKEADPKLVETMKEMEDLHPNQYKLLYAKLLDASKGNKTEEFFRGFRNGSIKVMNKYPELVQQGKLHRKANKAELATEVAGNVALLGVEPMVPVINAAKAVGARMDPLKQTGNKGVRNKLKGWFNKALNFTRNKMGEAVVLKPFRKALEKGKQGIKERRASRAARRLAFNPAAADISSFGNLLSKTVKEVKQVHPDEITNAYLLNSIKDKARKRLFRLALKRGKGILNSTQKAQLEAIPDSLLAKHLDEAIAKRRNM